MKEKYIMKDVVVSLNLEKVTEYANRPDFNPNSEDSIHSLKYARGMLKHYKNNPDNVTVSNNIIRVLCEKNVPEDEGQTEPDNAQRLQHGYSPEHNLIDSFSSSTPDENYSESIETHHVQPVGEESVFSWCSIL